MSSHKTLRDLKSIPEGIKSLLDSMPKDLEKISSLVEKEKPKNFILTGCGSSYYAALASSYAFKGLNVYVKPSGELSIYPHAVLNKGSLVIILSRSGETTEVLRGLRAAKKIGCTTIALTHSPKSSLAEEADLTVTVDVGPEDGLLMTKTFSGLTIAGTLVGLALSAREDMIEETGNLPEAAKETLTRGEKAARSLAERITEDPQCLFCLGEGPSYPAAMEGALKFMEGAEFPAQGIHGMEFRHGSKVIAYKSRLIIFALAGEAFKEMLKLAEDAEKWGADVILITNRDIENFSSLRVYWRGDELLTPSISTPLLHLTAYFVAVSKGINPDRPRNLSRFIKLE